MFKLNIVLDKLIWFLTLILFSSFYIFNTNEYSRYILLSITIIIVFLLFVKHGLKIRFYWHSFHTCVLLFALFCLVSCFWSIDMESSLIQTSIIFQLLICMSVLYIYFIQKENIIPMLDIIMWAGYIITIYSIAFYGIDSIKYIISFSKRLDNSISNTNNIGLLIAFSSVITIYKILFDKFKFYHLFIILNTILIALTGSRKALVIFILGIYAVFFFKYSKKNIIINLIYYFVVISILFFVFKLILELPFFTMINSRMETLFNFFTGEGKVDYSTILRQWMIHIGWQSFLEHPFLGLGIGSSGELLASTIGWRTYLHNNYIELLSGVGIIGTSLYYFMFLLPEFKMFKKIYSEDKNIHLCIILIFLLLLKDIGAVSYYDKSTYFYVMLFFIQMYFNKKNIKGIKRDNNTIIEIKK